MRMWKGLFYTRKKNNDDWNFNFIDKKYRKASEFSIFFFFIKPVDLSFGKDEICTGPNGRNQSWYRCGVSMNQIVWSGILIRNNSLSDIMWRLTLVSYHSGVTHNGKVNRWM